MQHAACSTCGRAAAHQCGYCRVPYCSRGCQSRAWPTHAARCTSRATFDDDSGSSSDGSGSESDSSSDSEYSSDEGSIGAQVPRVEQWKQSVAALLVAISRQSVCEIDRQIGKKEDDASYGLPPASNLRNLTPKPTQHVYFLLLRDAAKGSVPGAREALRRARAAPTSVPLDALVYVALQATSGIAGKAIATFATNIVELLSSARPRRAAPRQELIAKMTLAAKHINAITLASPSCSSGTGTFAQRNMCRPDPETVCAATPTKKR